MVELPLTKVRCPFQNLFLHPKNASVEILADNRNLRPLCELHPEQNLLILHLKYYIFINYDICQKHPIFNSFIKCIRYTTDYIKITFGIMSFGPIITSSRLPINKIIRPKKLAVCASTDRIHRSGLKINKNRPWNISIVGTFVVIHLYNKIEWKTLYQCLDTLIIYTGEMGDIDGGHYIR